MCGPPVRDQKLAPSQPADCPPVTILAVFLRMGRRSLLRMACRAYRSPSDRASSRAFLCPRCREPTAAEIESLYRFSCQLRTMDLATLCWKGSGACTGLPPDVEGASRMKRPTIADIARRAGVTKAAVSFALNGQPGVSAATRVRILAIADEIGFEPSSAARALSDGRAGAFGLIIDRPARTLGSEAFFMQLISGIQAELAQNHITLLFTMAEDQAEEIRMYRTWWAQRKVDGVFLVDLQVRDRRIRALEELGIPA